MPKILIDDNAHMVLKRVKGEMRKEGICSTFSGAIRRMYETYHSREVYDEMDG